MPDKTFRLEVVTPDRTLLSEKGITSLTAPGVEGYLGVMANHAPLMTELTIGELCYTKVDGTGDSLAIAGGFMEVRENNVTVLADIAELSQEIDVHRAEEALHRAQERISAHNADIDLGRAHVALLRALNRLQVAKHARQT